MQTFFRLNCYRNVMYLMVEKQETMSNLHMIEKSGTIHSVNMLSTILTLEERGGLMVYVSDSGSRGRGFEPHSGQTVLCP